jgi:TatD DNase family protein
MIDSHCHLDHLSDDACLQVFHRAKEAGVTHVVAVTTQEHSFLKTQALIATSLSRPPGFWITLGTHPHEASGYEISRWEALFGSQTYDVVGECGLDYHYDRSPRSTQMQVFEHQLEMARQHRKPVTVHVREAFEDAYRLLQEASAKGVRGVVHCFTGTPVQAQNILDLEDWYLGFTGIITFGQGAESIRDSLRITPMNRILIETDTPYLAPAPHRGKVNEPSFLPWVAQKVAEIKRVSMDQVNHQTRENTLRWLGIQEPSSSAHF